MPFLDKLQKFTLYLFFFAINFEMLQPIMGNDTFSVSRLAGIFYFLTIIPDFKLFFQTKNIKRFLVPIFLYYILESIMNLINLNEYSSEIFNSSILLNIIFFWIIINHERKEHLVIEKAMLSFAVGGLVLAILFYAGIGVEYEGGRVSMFGDDQNYIGFRTTVAVLIILLTIIQNRLQMSWHRYLLLLTIPLMVKLISETGSRGAFIAFVLTFIVGIILYRTKNIREKIITLIVGFMLFFILGTYLLESETMRNRLVNTAETADTGGRAAIWGNIIEIIKANPLLGVGRAGYAYSTTIIYGDIASPHNVILEIICYTGIVGLTIYFIFLYQIWISSYTIYRQTFFLLPILLLIPILGMILSIQILTKKFGWIIFAYIISSLAIKEKKPNHIIKTVDYESYSSNTTNN